MQINQPVYNITPTSKHFLLSKQSSLRDHSGQDGGPPRSYAHILNLRICEYDLIWRGKKVFADVIKNLEMRISL